MLSPTQGSSATRLTKLRSLDVNSAPAEQLGSPTIVSLTKPKDENSGGPASGFAHVSIRVYLVHIMLLEPLKSCQPHQVLYFSLTTSYSPHIFAHEARVDFGPVGRSLRPGRLGWSR